MLCQVWRVVPYVYDVLKPRVKSLRHLNLSYRKVYHVKIAIIKNVLFIRCHDPEVVKSIFEKPSRFSHELDQRDVQ
jgi:hypothetical protein